nr:hypothetical protein [Tanacetum cinerariifolium]
MTMTVPFSKPRFVAEKVLVESYGTNRSVADARTGCRISKSMDPFLFLDEFSIVSSPDECIPHRVLCRITDRYIHTRGSS